MKKGNENFINRLVVNSFKIVSILILTSCTFEKPVSVSNNTPENFGMKLEQYGITWYFDKSYEHGVFANGDHYVVADGSGKVTIIYIDPPSSSTASRQMNGSQINPVPIQTGSSKSITHGYDAGISNNNYYDPNLNVALDVSTSKVLSLPAGTSLVSTVSRVTPIGPPGQLLDAAVLTVLAVPPPEGSFRPPYSGTDKTIRFNLTDIHTSILPSLTQTGIAHRFNDNLEQFSYYGPLLNAQGMVAMAKRCWIDHFISQGAAADYILPQNNVPGYGREYCTFISELSIVACLTDAELTSYGITRQDILIGLIQIGIDNYEVLLHGGCWPNNGGENQGRKWPIIFAGALLGGATVSSGRAYDMLHANNFVFTPQYLYYSYGAMTKPFAEDQTIGYLSQAEIDATHVPYWGNQSHSPYVGPDSRDHAWIRYEDSDLGLPEWGIVRQTDPTSSNKYWVTQYRTDCTLNAYVGIALIARMIEHKDPTVTTMTAWGNNAFFDVVDRAMAIGTKNDWLRCYSFFTADMWDKYRASCGVGFIGHVYVNDKTVVTNCVNPTVGYDGATDGSAPTLTETSIAPGFAIKTSTFNAAPTIFAGTRKESADLNHHRIYGNCSTYGIVK